MKEYKYFFFDFDGMLVDTYPHIVTVFCKTLKETRKKEINFKEAYDKFKVSFKTAFDFYKMTEEEKALFKKNRDNLMTPPTPTLFPPVPKLLKTMNENGYTCFMYTDRSESLYDFYKIFDIQKYFKDEVISAKKPDPIPLLNLIEKYHLNKEECVMVGDRELDVLTAYKAGIDGILYDVDDRVILHHATYVIHHIQELYNFINVPYRMKNNYHCHTLRCGHAIGNDDDYVKKAIEAGYQTLGFSEHVFVPDIQKNYDFFDDVALLKEKYKDQIHIETALEVEYFEYYIPFYRKLLADKSVDYLIFGNHGTIGKDEKDKSNMISFIDHFEDEKYLDLYYECLERAVKTGLFKYIAHPDCFMKGYSRWDDKAIALTHKIAKLLEENHLYAELSASGCRSRKKFMYNGKLTSPYPFIEFYKILKQYNIKFVMGADAHAPEQLDDEAVKFVTDMAKELKLDVVYEIDWEEKKNG